MLEGKIIFITGATSGIGLACATVFASQGCKLILLARRNDRLKEISNAIHTAYNTVAHTIAIDINNLDEVFSHISKIPSELKGIDILINNAGVVTTDKKFQEMKASDVDHMIDTNFKSLAHITRILLPGMLERKNGQVVNIGSIASEFCYPGGSIYASTKYAVKAFTRSLRMDLLGTPIKVSQVNPGGTRTEISEIRWNKEKADAYYNSFTPLNPDDVAEAVLFCCTRKAYINIDNLTVTPLEQMECRIKPILKMRE